MSGGLTFPDELVIEGIATAWTRFLETRPQLGEEILHKIAEMHAELMTSDAAAAMLGISKDTLRSNYRKYGLQKSTALGQTQPRFFRSQVMEAVRAHGKVIHGHKQESGAGEKVVPIRLPKRRAPTLPPGSSIAS